MAAETHILTHEFPPFRGGIGLYAEETARAISGAGGMATVWAPGYGDVRGDRFPFAVRRIPMAGRQDWPCRLRLARALKESFPSGRVPGSIVLAEPGPVRLWMYRKFLGLPKPQRLVLILHGSELRRLASPFHRRQLFRKLILEADVVGVVSRAVRDMLLDFCPQAEAKVVLVPGAVRSAWSELPAPASGPHAETAEILQVGRIHPRKGQAFLMEALALLPDDCLQGLRVRIVGPTGRRRYLDRVKALIRENRLPVELAGALGDDELREAYAAASLLVMPSQPLKRSIEGLGIALLEAQHFGCPVIGTAVGGIAEALVDGESGLLVPPGDPQALAGAIKQLVDHPAEAARMGQAGARFVRGHFSWEANVHRLGLA
jgi:glycosyltransferase involved in cell wall biosynthesis